MGYEDVVSLAGGFAAWNDAGLPSVQHHSDFWASASPPRIPPASHAVGLPDAVG